MEAGTPVLVFPSGKVSHNAYIHKWAEDVKPLIIDLMEHANMVRLFFVYQYNM